MQNFYQSIIGSLRYLVTRTSPDFAFSVLYLSHFSSHPLVGYHGVVKRVFRFLAATSSRSLKSKPSSTAVPLSIGAFSDSCYASSRDTRRSVSGYTFILNSYAISCVSKIQHAVASFTTEPEYIALANTSPQAAWCLDACT